MLFPRRQIISPARRIHYPSNIIYKNERQNLDQTLFDPVLIPSFSKVKM